MSLRGTNMEEANSPEGRVRAILALHAGIAGAAWATTGYAGILLAVEGSTGSAAWIPAIAVSALAFAVGLWVGAPDAGAENPSVHDRWLAAGALTAVGATFGTFTALYANLFPSFPWKVGCLLLSVAVPAYAIGRIPVALVARMARDLDNEDGDPALVGRVVAGVVTPALLAGFVAALLLAGFAIADGWSPGSVMMLAAVALLVPRLFRLPVTVEPEEMLLAEVGSPLGVWTVTEIVYPGERQPERRLYLNEEEESGEMTRSGAPTLAYVAAAEHWLVSSTPPAADYLFLGGGAYTLPRRIAERDGSAGITVVELDPEATRLAQQFFGLKPHHRIRSIHGDARAYLETAATGSVDRIYLDVYGGREMTPYSLVTREAVTRVAEVLRSGGVMGMNVIGTLGGAEAVQFWSVIRTFSDVFPVVDLWAHRGRDFPDPQNFLLVASMEPVERMSLTIGTFEHWPREEWHAEENAVVFHDLSAPARLAPPRASRR